MLNNKEKFYVVKQESKNTEKYLPKGYVSLRYDEESFIEPANFSEVKQFRTKKGAEQVRNFYKSMNKDNENNPIYRYEVVTIMREYRAIRE